MIYKFICPRCRTYQPLVAQGSRQLVWLQTVVGDSFIAGHSSLDIDTPQSPWTCSRCGYQPSADEMKRRGAHFDWCGCRYRVRVKNNLLHLKRTWKCKTCA